MTSTSFEDVMQKFPASFHQDVEVEFNRLVEENETLQHIRKARNLTQKAIAARLGIEQVNVSRLENKADMLISTLASYIEAMGGKLTLAVEFPDKPAISIKLSELTS